jgi:flagellar biosynthesis protein FlhA
METLKTNAHKILSRESVQKLLENLKRENKTVVEELVPNVLTVGQVQKVLQNLLAEGLSVRDLVTILETLGDYAHMTKDPDLLTEAVRGAMSESISARYRDETGAINAVTLDPKLEQLINEGVSKAAQRGEQFVLPPDIFRKLYQKMNAIANEVKTRGLELIVVTAPNVRRFFRNFIEPFLPQAAVLSFSELPPKVQIKSLKMLSLQE